MRKVGFTMKDSKEPPFPDKPGFEDLKRFISRNLPENMGLLDLVLIGEWLSQAMQNYPDKSKKVGDFKKLRIELEKRIQDHKKQSR